jgi:hypothetical protein
VCVLLRRLTSDTRRLSTVFAPDGPPAVQTQFDEGPAMVRANGRPYTSRQAQGEYRYVVERVAAGLREAMESGAHPQSGRRARPAFLGGDLTPLWAGLPPRQMRQRI